MSCISLFNYPCDSAQIKFIFSLDLDYWIIQICLKQSSHFIWLGWYWECGVQCFNCRGFIHLYNITTNSSGPITMEIVSLILICILNTCLSRAASLFFRSLVIQSSHEIKYLINIVICILKTCPYPSREWACFQFIASSGLLWIKYLSNSKLLFLSCT